MRREAEKIARENAYPSPENLLAMSHEANRHALHELRVHQIELEMQNSALRRAQLELEASQARYFDLYDLAPVGYVTLSEKGLILDANLAASTMLGVARGLPDLAQPIFTQLIHIEDQDIYYLFHKQLLETGKTQACELRMVKKDGPVFWAHMETTTEQGTDGAPVSYVALIDITERKRLDAELNHHSKRLATLNEIGSEITSELNIDALLLSIVKRACDLIGGTYCTCYLYRPEMDLLERGACVGEAISPGPQFRKCGEGFVGHIWSIQAPFLSNDYLSWRGRKKEYDSLPPRAMVGAPINFGDQFLGVLVVTAYLPHQFTQADTDMLGMFAIQAAIAIRNAQLYDQMDREIFERRKAEQEIALLAGIGRLVSSTMNIDEIYEQFAAEAQKLISFDSISINVFNFQENTLRIAYVSGVDIDGRRPGDTIVLAGSLSEAVMRTRTGLRVQPASFDEIEDQFPLLSPMFQAEMQSIVSVPLIYRNEVIGVLHFSSKKQNAYTEQAFHLAERIAIQVAGAIGNAHLFNDLNKAEKALRESNELFTLFMRHSPVYTYIKEMTPTQSIILQASDNFRQMIGIPGSEMVGKNVNELFPPELAAKITADDCAVVSSGDVLRLDEEFNGRNYTTIKFPIVLGDKTLLAGYTIDITERKQAETEREKLESQNRQLHKAESLNRMAGAIAHTFNNQLGVVIGNLELALMDLPKVAGPILHSLTAAMRASQKAAEVSGQMLTYLGQSFDKRELLDLSETCRRNLPIHEASMPGTVKLEINLPSPGPAVMINASEIQQVLTNLITNACEAVGTGRGSIHLSVKTASPADIPESHRFPVGQQPQESAYACLEVADTGCGIAENDIEKLFDPFFTSKFTGRGLGLAMVLGIVKAHDGCVTVESTPGQGSTFRVFLPVSAEEAPRQPDFVAQPLATGGGTILLVDDEEMLRDMAAALLTRLGFSVLAAKDGVEAVEIFRQRQDEIRLVLSDLTMPRMNGWETLTALRELAPDLPVILASGYDKAQVMAGDHPELPQVFLGKPYTLKGLGEAISQALVGKKQ